MFEIQTLVGTTFEDCNGQRNGGALQKPESRLEKIKEKEGSETCRFYALGKEGCEIGRGGLSPSEVETAARYCSSDYLSCARYSMLCERERTGQAEVAVRARRPAAPESLEESLRAPVANIKACAEILKREVDRAPEVSVRFAGLIHEEARKLDRTLDTVFVATEPPKRQTPTITPAPRPGVSNSNSEISRKRSRGMEKKGINPGWTVVMAGTGINLALGILYAWSIFKGEIAKSVKAGGDFNWDPASINDPYALCCLVFAFAMIVAGKCQDKIGPRVTAMIGGILVGAGFIMISLTNDYWMWLLGFGVLAGMGIGFGYSSATPPAIKWFPPAKTGMIAGIVVSGFGLASVYIAPLAKYLVGTLGLSQTMFVFGVAFAIVVTTFSILLLNPPKPALAVASVNDPKASVAVVKTSDAGPRTMLKSYKFYALWIAFFVGSGAGLMVIGSVAGMAKASLGEAAFYAVALMAIGNAAGRIVAGSLSDRIGRVNTLLLVHLAQAILMFAGVLVVGGNGMGPVLIVALATFIGFNYGANLALFPSLAKDYWGLKNFGLNYGLLFTAWGVGGFVMGRVSQMLETSNGGSFTPSFITAGVMLLLGSGVTATLKIGSGKAAKATALEAETKVKVA